MSVRASLLLLVAAALFTVAAHGQTLRDPMRPAGATTVSSAARPAVVAALRLEGVIAGPVRVAIVNGRPVRAGDVVGTATILEVLHDGVRYSRGGRIQTLVLPGARPIPGVRVARSSEATPP